MKINVLLFGIATDLIGSSSLTIELPISCNVTSFKELLTKKYPELKQMSSYAIAINESYATDETIIKENDIIAIIPPVSGG
ncbi:molybdopterin converting factor subunit 1 [Tenacibaculum sp. AHE15PA]|uniref:molybdopterin converting factor subunit 1 n=1 Tax=unclassified Tenacibaculum TaxID=2635139 RepID=UPI001C4EC0BB|nr:MULTISPECIES: molybdopterin converting factor subunit 1 [unclassified Tenacibaculum]QXP72989.1 molybdopterin converting factor subunit 1 [Tenacibaculum sp. AHE14PA]QXP76903.1 molybdopterin converting factor subunit 1 [Tenacibaculum sp. AHE15PA]